MLIRERVNNFHLKNKILLFKIILTIKNINPLIFITIMGMFISWAIILSQSPFYLDDWSWGTCKLNIVNIGYAGRFIGNFFEIILAGSHNQIFNGIFKSSVLTFLCIIICLISNKINVSRIILFNSLFLLVNMSILYESLVFSPGFSNYTLPFVFVLPVVLINQKLKRQKYVSYFTIIMQLISLMCIFASGFFLENISTTMIFYLGTELILNIILKRKNLIYSLIAVITSIASFRMMMLHSERFAVNAVGYRIPSFSSFSDLIQNIKVVNIIIMNNLFHDNIFFLVVITVLFVAFIMVVVLRLKTKKEQNNYYIHIIQTLLIILCPTYQLIFLSPNLIYHRMFYISIMVLIVSGMLLFGFIENNIVNKKHLKKFVGLIFIYSLIFSTPFFIDMAKWNDNIHKANEKAITQQIDIEYSKIKPVYHAYYCLDANGPLLYPAWLEAYKKYYNIPNEVNIK
jgi:hypothetical protein